MCGRFTSHDAGWWQQASVSHQPRNHEGQLPIHLERLDPAAVVFPLSTLFNKWHGLPGGASLPANAGDIRDVGSSPALKRSPWKEEMATCSSILAWRFPWVLVGYSPWGHKESDMTEVT